MLFIIIWKPNPTQQSNRTSYKNPEFSPRFNDVFWIVLVYFWFDFFFHSRVLCISLSWSRKRTFITFLVIIIIFLPNALFCLFLTRLRKSKLWKSQKTAHSNFFPKPDNSQIPSFNIPQSKVGLLIPACNGPIHPTIQLDRLWGQRVKLFIFSESLDWCLKYQLEHKMGSFWNRCE